MDQPNQAAGVFDIFATDTGQYNESTTDESTGSVNPDFYRPRLGKDQKEYSSRLRFLPNVLDPSNSVISKYGYYFDSDPENPERSLWVDCTSNDKGSKPNIITHAFWQLKKMENVAWKKISKSFSRKQYFYMLVYVMNDLNSIDDNGKVRILRFGSQINTMNQQQINGDQVNQIPGCTFYNPVAGRDLFLKINKKNVEFNGKPQIITNYDTSRFDPTITPFGFVTHDPQNNMTINRIDPTSTEDRNRLVEFLKAESPDLSQVAYIPWDDQMREKAELIVRNIIGNDQLFDKIYMSTYGNKPRVSTNPAPAQVAAQPTANTAPIQPVATATNPITNPAPVAQTIAAVTTPPVQNQPAPIPPTQVDDGFDGLDLDELDDINIDDL